MTELEEKVVNYDFLKAAINRQMMRCMNKEHYKAGIFISDGGKLGTVTDIIKELVENDYVKYLSDNHPVRLSAFETEVVFNNGSTLRTARGNENSRMCRFHDIIYDSEISNEIVSMVIYPIHVPYYTNDYENNNNGTDGVRPNMRIVECII